MSIEVRNADLAFLTRLADVLNTLERDWPDGLTLDLTVLRGGAKIATWGDEDGETIWELGPITMPDPTTPPPLDDRETVRDEIAGFPIGGGYYATAVGVDEAGEIADAVLAVLDLPARDTRTWWNGYDVGQQDATGVPANGDGTYNYALDHGPRPQEAPDAR